MHHVKFLSTKPSYDISWKVKSIWDTRGAHLEATIQPIKITWNTPYYYYFIFIFCFLKKVGHQNSFIPVCRCVSLSKGVATPHVYDSLHIFSWKFSQRIRHWIIAFRFRLSHNPVLTQLPLCCQILISITR